MEAVNEAVCFIKIKESEYKRLKENNELKFGGFYLVEKDDQEGKEEDELAEG